MDIMGTMGYDMIENDRKLEKESWEWTVGCWILWDFTMNHGEYLLVI